MSDRILVPDRIAWLAGRLADAPHGSGALLILLVHRGGEDGKCSLGAKAMAAAVGCSERTVRRQIDELEAKGLIHVKRRLSRTPIVTVAPDAAPYELQRTRQSERRGADTSVRTIDKQGADTDVRTSDPGADTSVRTDDDGCGHPCPGVRTPVSDKDHPLRDTPPAGARERAGESRYPRPEEREAPKSPSVTECVAVLERAGVPGDLAASIADRWPSTVVDLEDLVAECVAETGANPAGLIRSRARERIRAADELALRNRRRSSTTVHGGSGARELAAELKAHGVTKIGDRALVRLAERLNCEGATIEALRRLRGSHRHVGAFVNLLQGPAGAWRARLHELESGERRRRPPGGRVSDHEPLPIRRVAGDA